jgi:alanine-alpha-ketoisovalerate/valine-pyruvate aminotransferase
VWLAVGVGVGLALAPTPTVQQTIHTRVETVPVAEDVTLTCQQAATVTRWDGPTEDDDLLRADCTIVLLHLLGWELTFTNIAVANDYADVMYGGPCAGLEQLREEGSW